MKKTCLLLLISLSLSSCITSKIENEGSFIPKDDTKSMFVTSDKVKPGMLFMYNTTQELTVVLKMKLI